MATITVKSKIIVRNDTDANWVSANPVLLKGEAGYCTDKLCLKFGDGSTKWNDLPKFGGQSVIIQSTAPSDGSQHTYEEGTFWIDLFCILSRNLHIDPTGERQPRVAPTHHGRGTRSKRGDAGKGFLQRKAKPVPRPDMSIRHSQPTSSKRPELLHWQEPSRETRPSTVVRTYLSKHR